MLKVNDVTMIKEIADCISVQKIFKGWSNDKKYHIVTAKEDAYLLRVFNKIDYEHKQLEFRMMCEAYKQEIPMSKPITMGMINEQEGYLLLTWCHGIDGEQRITQLDESTQYQLGVMAGTYLKKLHEITITEPTEPWGSRFNKKIDRNQNAYQTCPLSYEDDQYLLDFVQKNRHRLYKRP